MKNFHKMLFFTSVFFCFYGSTENISNLQTATKFKESIKVSDYLVSEKLDGVRGRWDGQLMWTRAGNTINLPQWFTENFPKVKLDGELWIGRGKFEQISALIRTKKPKERLWKQVKFMVFDAPEHQGNFESRYQYLLDKVEGKSQYLSVVEQFQVHNLYALEKELDHRVALGAEGLMLHKKTSFYRNGRNSELIKFKQFEDAEAKVIGYIEGKGRLNGMMGALLVETATGKHFKIGTGFSDEERRSPPEVGSIITYKYSGVTQKGTPRFASFLRIRWTAEESENKL